MASTSHPTDLPAPWLTIEQAAAQLGLSPRGFQELAAVEGIVVERHSRRLKVRASEVHAFLDRTRIARVDETLLRDLEIDGPLPGVDLLDELRVRFGWSDQDIA